MAERPAAARPEATALTLRYSDGANVCMFAFGKVLRDGELFLTS